MEKGVEVAPDLRMHGNLLAFWSNNPNLAPWQSSLGGRDGAHLATGAISTPDPESLGFVRKVRSLI